MSYKRIMLKLSGEAFSKDGVGQGINQPTLRQAAQRIAEVANTDVQLIVVVGGGNIWRYRDNEESGIERTASDTMGMLATVMNGVALQASLEQQGVSTRVLSAIQVPQVAEPYIRRRAMRHLEKGRVIICVGGTGNPFFTTDSAAALRASELACDIILKASNVDGVYDKDPNKYDDATKYDAVTYQEAIEKQLNVMDQAAFSLCRDQNLPIRVFDFSDGTALLAAAKGDHVGTLVHG